MDLHESLLRSHAALLPAALLLAMLLQDKDTRHGIADSWPATAASSESLVHFLLAANRLKLFERDAHRSVRLLGLLQNIPMPLQTCPPYSMMYQSVQRSRSPKYPWFLLPAILDKGQRLLDSDQSKRLTQLRQTVSKVHLAQCFALLLVWLH